MENAITLQPGNADIISSLVINGDLSKLTAAQQVQYYNQFCQSLGLNPLTKPFDLLVLNNKKVLYANKNCAEQLRQNHGVSTIEMNSQTINDVFIVTVKVQNSAGRIDIATGAVPIKGLSGNELANAMMKTETKAKRRATLSLCSIGVLDESELDTIPDASKVSMPEINVTNDAVHTAMVEPSTNVQEPSNHGYAVLDEPIPKDYKERKAAYKAQGYGCLQDKETKKMLWVKYGNVPDAAQEPATPSKISASEREQLTGMMDEMGYDATKKYRVFQKAEIVGAKIAIEGVGKEYDVFLRKKEIVESQNDPALHLDAQEASFELPY